MGPVAGTACNATALSYENSFDIGLFIDPTAIEAPGDFRDAVEACVHRHPGTVTELSRCRPGTAASTAGTDRTAPTRAASTSERPAPRPARSPSTSPRAGCAGPICSWWRGISRQATSADRARPPGRRSGASRSGGRRSVEGRRSSRRGLAGRLVRCVRRCRAGNENLCADAEFTGWDRDGGYAETMTARADFVFADSRPVQRRRGGTAAVRRCDRIPVVEDVRHPCRWPARAVRLRSVGAAGDAGGAPLGVRGVRGHPVGAERRRAIELGAAWVGGYDDAPPVPLDAAVTFAPVGSVVVAALRAVGPGGTVAINAIHLDEIPAFDYDLLWRRARACAVWRTSPAATPRSSCARGRDPDPDGRRRVSSSPTRTGRCTTCRAATSVGLQCSWLLTGPRHRPLA